MAESASILILGYRFSLAGDSLVRGNRMYERCTTDAHAAVDLKLGLTFFEIDSRVAKATHIACTDA